MLDDPSAHIQVNRIIVFDAGGNGVQTLRGFNDSDEYYRMRYRPDAKSFIYKSFNNTVDPTN
jgi:hypothetical protein